MLLVGDLGISSVVLAVCLVFPVFGFLIRRQWRLAAARKEEIRRLLILASEEAARAELEASAGYVASGGPPSGVSNGFHCAVCYCPTTTRCSRCKAVRYCSGKCQIIHWRQGHKDECHPPSTTYKTDDGISNTGLKLVENDQGNTHSNELESEAWQHAEPAATPTGESISSDSTRSREHPHDNVTDIKVDFLADKEEANSIAETTVSSFSGFSSSSPSNDSSDDISVCESISSLDSESPETPPAADFPVEAPKTSFNANDVAPSKPLSPKFTHLVESVDNIAKLSKLNQIRPGVGVEDSRCGSSSSSVNVIDRHDKLVGSPSTVSSGFWGRTLESVDSVGDACDDSALPRSCGAGNSNLSDSGSPPRFSSRSREATSLDPAKVSDMKNSISDEAAMALLQNDKPVGGATLSKTSCERSSNRTNFGSRASVSEEAKSSPSSTSSSFHQSVGIKEVSTCTKALDNGNYSSLHSDKANSMSKDPGSTSFPLRTTEVLHLSSSVSNSSIPSGGAEHFALSERSGKVSDNESRAAVALHATSSQNSKNGLKSSVLKVVDQFRRSNSKSSNLYPVAGSEIARGRGDKELFPFESFIKLYSWSKVELQPCGLINCGNSCYANVVLQCLMFTPPLTSYFLQGFHSKACSKKEWCFTCEFESLVLKAKGAKSPLSPIGILSKLQNMGSQLGNGREEDAHEFLRFAVDAMQSICIKEAGYDTSGSPEREETTLIGLTFGGYLRSKIKCTKCQGKSERRERMMDLTVEIEGDISTLEEALRRFTRTEILDGDNKYKCGRCKSYERAKKKLKILEAPNVLTIALKRFQSGKFGKLNKSIRFPETLDLAPYVSGRSEKSHSYRLYGVVVHLDIMNAAFSGHYICYVKNFQNKWYKVDDSTVTVSELDRVLTKGAYMLLYARTSPRAPRLILTRTVSLDLKNKAPQSGVSEKKTIPLSKSTPTNSSVRSANSPDGQASIQSFYSTFHRLQRILEEDSSSDSSSLFSSNSDEGSCSTDSTMDSTSADEFADFIFGDIGRGWRNSPGSDTSSSSSSSSPLKTTPSPLADSDRYSSATEDIWDRQFNGRNKLEGTGGDTFLHSNSIKYCSRTLGNSSSRRETDSERIGQVNRLKDVRPAES